MDTLTSMGGVRERGLLPAAAARPGRCRQADLHPDPSTDAAATRQLLARNRPPARRSTRLVLAVADGEIDDVAASAAHLRVALHPRSAPWPRSSPQFRRVLVADRCGVGIRVCAVAVSTP